MTVTIDKSGRVLIPKAVRDRLGLEPGTALSLGVREGGGGAPTLELRAETEEAEEPALVWENGLLVHTGEVEHVDVAELLREQREERARKHAGLSGYDR